MVVASGFGPECVNSVPDGTKDPPSACSVPACKICGSESPVIGC